MIDRNSFDGSLQFGPRTFCEKTGRDKVFASQPAAFIPRALRCCPLCGAGRNKFLFKVQRDEVNTWDYSRCPECGMIYTVSAPTESELRRIYESAPAQQEWVKLQQNPLELQLDRAKFQWALEQIKWPFGNCRILDIGCSTGTLLSVANDLIPKGTKNAVLAGVEINCRALEVASGAIAEVEKRAMILNSDIEPMKHLTVDGVKTGFDLVVLWEVLEHVLEPHKMLQQAMDLVVPGGWLMLCVPNADALAVRLLREKCSVFGLGHLQLYSPLTLARAINNAYVSRCGKIDTTKDFYRPASVYSMQTIISWSRELANWMKFQDPMAGNEPVHDMFTPEEIHKRLMGYKLVAWVQKEQA